jgi:hypothetical protein
MTAFYAQVDFQVSAGRQRLTISLAALISRGGVLKRLNNGIQNRDDLAGLQ